MAEPLVVKEGDASLRLATDLPRFNWLELKWKPDGEPSNMIPLKMRILEKTSSGTRLAEADLKKLTEVKDEPTCASRWPLKKRLIRQESQVSPASSPVDHTRVNGAESPAQSRGPVIMRNVLPPTPPASSAPPEIIPGDQEKPLDLSRPVPRQREAEVEIIAMTTRRPAMIRPTAFQPVRPTSCPAPKHLLRPAYSIQRLPTSIRAPEPTFPDWSRNITMSAFRPHQMAPPGRPFILPPLRPLPQHWNTVMQQRHIIRPEVQLHPVRAPRLFHAQQVAPKKQPQQAMAVLPPEWASRSCVVCSRRADFRCAGCHGNAYCSTVCQARDWPNHSQLCQRNS